MLVTLVACAESEVSPVTTGTTDGEISSNGLRFADESIIELGDLGPTEEVGDESTLVIGASLVIKVVLWEPFFVDAF